MDSEKFHIKMIMAFFSKIRKYTAKTCKNLCEMYGDNAVNESRV